MQFRQLALIDSSLPDCAALCEALPPNVEIVLLQPETDGFAQLAAELRRRSDLDALHLITHGAPGKVFIGASTLDQSSLPHHPDLLDAIRDAFSENGEWLIYGCDVGAGLADGHSTIGQSFLGSLMAQTGLRIAAASHPVGYGPSGGSWCLDVAQIPVHQAVAAAPLSARPMPPASDSTATIRRPPPKCSALVPMWTVLPTSRSSSPG